MHVILFTAKWWTGWGALTLVVLAVSDLVKL